MLVANILAGPLISLADTLTNLTLPGGKLCLSGITAGQAMEVQSAYPAVNFAPPALREEWVRLTGTRTATRA